MAKRRKSDGAEDIMNLLSLLPWWAGVLLAIASYWLLHDIAVRPLSVGQSAQQLGIDITTPIIRALATVGQYLVPLLCLAGAVASALRRWQRRALFNTATANQSLDALQSMTWRQFEQTIGEYYRRCGYAVKERGGSGADGGVDLVLTKDGEKTFVQCKHWKAFKVSVPIVRELYGVMAAEGAAQGVVITSGRFTPAASAFASGRNIQLIDGSKLPELLYETRHGSTIPYNRNRT